MKSDAVRPAQGIHWSGRGTLQQHPTGWLADRLIQRSPENRVGRTAKERRQIRAGVGYALPVGQHREQRAVRLDCAGNVDRLPLARD
jgi:hypothetical protein